MGRGRFRDQGECTPRNPDGTDGHPTLEPNTEGSVGFVDEKGMRIFEKRRKAEGKMAERRGVSMENTEVALGNRIRGA